MSTLDSDLKNYLDQYNQNIKSLSQILSFIFIRSKTNPELQFYLERYKFPQRHLCWHLSMNTINGVYGQESAYTDGVRIYYSLNQNDQGITFDEFNNDPRDGGWRVSNVGNRRTIYDWILKRTEKLKNLEKTNFQEFETEKSKFDFIPVTQSFYGGGN